MTTERLTPKCLLIGGGFLPNERVEPRFRPNLPAPRPKQDQDKHPQAPIVCACATCCEFPCMPSQQLGITRLKADLPNLDRLEVQDSAFEVGLLESGVSEPGLMDKF
jgi:hypothetical protein